MKKCALIAILICAAALTGCGEENAKNESSLVIELQTTTAAATTAAETTVSVTVSSTASVASSSQTSSTAVSETTSAVQTTTTSQSTVSETTTTTSTTSTTVQTTTTQTTPPPAVTTTVDPSKPLTLFKNLNIGDDCSAYVKQHTDYKFSEAISCHGEGKDRVYTYDNYILNTFFNGKKDVVYEIMVIGPGITVENQLTFGMDKAAVIAAIGEGDDDIYHRRGYDLMILYDDDDKICEISLSQLEE